MEDKIDVQQILNNEHLKLLQILDEWYEPSQHQNLSELIEEIKIIEKLSFKSNKILLILDHRNFLPVYISESSSLFGYTPDEIYEMSLFQAMQRVYWRQIPLVTRIHRDGQHFRKITKSKSLKHHETYICGAKLKNRWGKVRTFFVKQRFLKANKKGEPTLSYLEVEDISHIYKNSKGWSRMIDTSFDIPIIRAYFPYNNKKIANEVLSDRELDILNLVVKNKEGSFIAKELNISLETVKKHRKNMLAKTGLKDMTALIYICKQCNII